jgi:hypothetical protein
VAWLSDVIAATPGLRQGLIFTPSSTSDPYLDDGPPPQLGLQLLKIPLKSQTGPKTFAKRG